jgi:two-component system, cell cycle response regulator DivK
LNTRPTDPPAPGPPRILVVEDHEWNARLLKGLLLAAGFDARSAGDGREALALVDSFRPHLILMDLELPDIGGLALTRILKASAATRGAAIVALTAHAPAEVEAAVRAAGGAGVLAKPVDPQAFGDTVRRYLPK